MDPSQQLHFQQQQQQHYHQHLQLQQQQQRQQRQQQQQYHHHQQGTFLTSAQLTQMKAQQKDQMDFTTSQLYQQHSNMHLGLPSYNSGSDISESPSPAQAFSNPGSAPLNSPNVSPFTSRKELQPCSSPTFQQQNVHRVTFTQQDFEMAFCKKEAELEFAAMFNMGH